MDNVKNPIVFGCFFSMHHYYINKWLVQTDVVIVKKPGLSTNSLCARLIL
jgi:hypothetical protein